MHLSINVARAEGDNPGKNAVRDFKAEAKRRGFKITKGAEPEVTVNGGIVRVESQVEPTDPPK